MVGIYKITTPSGKVYIGQSINISRRWCDHKWPNKRSVSLISRSVKKYGYKNHLFQIIHELPNDAAKETISKYESLYMDLYRSAGVILLNISDARDSNFGYKPTPETIEKHASKLRGRPSVRKGTTHTDEAKAKIKAKRALQINVSGRPKGNIPWNKGKTGLQVSHNKGVPLSQESKDKISKTLTGRKLSAESIAKRTASVMARTERKKDWSDEAKEKQRQRVILFNQNKRINAIL